MYNFLGKIYENTLMTFNKSFLYLGENFLCLFH